MKLKLIDRKKESGNVISFIFEADSSLTWTAGQYLIYSLEHKKKDLRGKQRFFTISSSPFEKNPVITTKISKNTTSSFKKQLSAMRIGEYIEAKGPDGDFVLKDLNKKYVFIAGGIGITPFISMLRQINHDNKKVKITLLYSNKNKDVVFKNELSQIAKKNSGFRINYIFSPMKVDRNLLKKFVDLPAGRQDKKTFFYVSGPDPMVEAVTKLLIELGISKENIKEDYFSGYKKI